MPMGFLKGTKRKGTKMLTIISKLENNLFDDILIKKGSNNVKNIELSSLLKNTTFKSMCAKGYIKILGNKQSKPQTDDKVLDFESMNYQELQKYVKAHQIKTNGTKKADLLAAIEIYMKNE